jgi:mono/diheme cytochrome c family protein
MKKFKKITFIILVIIIVAIGILLSYVKFVLPDTGKAQDLKFDYTPERIERGHYLATSVCVCMDCHSSRDWTKFSGPLSTGTLGKGGERFGREYGFPGEYFSKNITPFGISRYTDGELYRVITTGVTKEGKALFPVMPYIYYGSMDPDDIKCIIAYIRSLPGIESKVPNSESDFPMNFIINLIPKKSNPQKIPSKENKIAYGAYLTNAAGCIECHTQAEKGQIIREKAFGGGREFPIINGNGAIVRSANITPDKKTGIGNWTQEAFIARFKIYSDTSINLPVIKPGEFNSIMPWTMYTHMNNEDLAAIYSYLHSLKPIENTVVKFSPKL